MVNINEKFIFHVVKCEQFSVFRLTLVVKIDAVIKQNKKHITCKCNEYVSTQLFVTDRCTKNALVFFIVKYENRKRLGNNIQSL